jgi:hypothetical protein
MVSKCVIAGILMVTGGVMADNANALVIDPPGGSSFHNTSISPLGPTEIAGPALSPVRPIYTAVPVTLRVTEIRVPGPSILALMGIGLAAVGAGIAIARAKKA